MSMAKKSPRPQHRQDSPHKIIVTPWQLATRSCGRWCALPCSTILSIGTTYKHYHSMPFLVSLHFPSTPCGPRLVHHLFLSGWILWAKPATGYESVSPELSRSDPCQTTKENNSDPWVVLFCGRPILYSSLLSNITLGALTISTVYLCHASREAARA